MGPHRRGLLAMKPTHNDIFRLVSLRGPERGFTVDPTEDGAGREVERLLQGVPVDPRNPQPSTARRLADVAVVSGPDLERSSIAAAEAALHRARVATLKDLRDLRLEGGG